MTNESIVSVHQILLFVEFVIALLIRQRKHSYQLRDQNVSEESLRAM